MPNFRIYTIGHDGHCMHADDIECADDQEAIKKAQRATVGRAMGKRPFVARLAAKPKQN